MNDWRPRIKPEHGMHRYDGGRIRIGSTSVHGIAAEIIDESGFVWEMLNAADGSRTVDEVVDCVVAAYPHVADDVVRDALTQFTDGGYFENIAAPTPAVFSEREVERYQRNRGFFRWMDMQKRDSSWEPQLALHGARVVIVGMGGTGGVAALSLAASGVGALHCVDADVVELSNLNRQIQYTEDDIGQPKVDVIVERLRRLNSDIAVMGQQLRIRSDADLESLVESCDVLLLCADEPGELRAWVNRVCLQQRKPWVDAGYHGPVVTAAAYVPYVGPCYECNWFVDHEKKLLLDPSAVYSSKRGGHQAVAATSAGISGYLASHLCLALITGIPQVVPGRVQGVNLFDAEDNDIVKYERHPQCPACGGGQLGV